MSKRKGLTKDAKKKNKKKKPTKENERLQAQAPAKGTCFHCKEEGYWKRNCHLYLSELKAKKKASNVPSTSLHVLESFYVDDSSLSWIVNSGATNHVCSSLQLLSSCKDLEEGELTPMVGNRESVSAKAVVAARLGFGSRFMLINSIYFIPIIRRDLISTSVLCRQLFSISFDNNAIIIYRNGLEIYRTCLEYGLYILRSFKSRSYNIEMFRVANPSFDKI